MKYDVLVAGGGSAGIAAAFSAAAQGAQTCLIERRSCLGGMASQALVHSICGLYELPQTAEAEAQYANSGFAKFFAERLIAAGGAGRPQRLGRVDVLFHDPKVFAKVAEGLIGSFQNLTYLPQTKVLSAAADLSSAELIFKNERQKIVASSWVDATGDAALASLCGATCEMASSEYLQRPAFIFSVAGVPAEVVNTPGRLRLAKVLGDAVKSGALPTSAFGITARAAHRAGEIFFTMNLSADFSAAESAYNPLDASQHSLLNAEGRMFAQKLIGFLRENLKGFSDCRLAAFPECLGVRESRRVRGRYQLTAEDLDCGRRFEDGIGRATWPMELREKAHTVELKYPKKIGGCDLPLRMLQSQEKESLFMAGRCVSATHEAQASVRVIGTCFVTGEAAGIAAALRAQEKKVTAPAIAAARRKIICEY
ncbi:MAG: FAD-dependent oxidoreductase [Chthoniobacterales bacterium]